MLAYAEGGPLVWVNGVPVGQCGWTGAGDKEHDLSMRVDQNVYKKKWNLQVGFFWCKRFWNPYIWGALRKLMHYWFPNCFNFFMSPGTSQVVDARVALWLNYSLKLVEADISAALGRTKNQLKHLLKSISLLLPCIFSRWFLEQEKRSRGIELTK